MLASNSGRHNFVSVTHAANALDRVADVEVEIVADEERVVLPVIGVEAGAENEVAGVLADGDAGLLHFGRQTSEGAGGAVLHHFSRPFHGLLFCAMSQAGASRLGAL